MRSEIVGKPKTPSSSVGSVPSQVIAGWLLSGATSLPARDLTPSCSRTFSLSAAGTMGGGARRSRLR
jgi:hypothetical protein